MPLKHNSKILNNLQLKTLALFQEFAEFDFAMPGEELGDIDITQIPRPHENHFHVGKGVVLTKDATGLSNRGVWAALNRKGLIRSGKFLFSTTITSDGLAYETGMKEIIIHDSDH